ncbi:MAG TPA: hypothetical protein GXX70_09310 [Tepidimicrobium sp.]|nr:hypothetical protein [Tepidimicrobium sp.]
MIKDERKNYIYWILVLLLISVPFVKSTGAHHFPSSPDSSFVIQDKAGIISTSIQQQIVSINDYLHNKNYVNVIFLTFDENIKGDKDYFLNNYKRTWHTDKNIRTFIVAIFPSEIVLSIDKTIRSHFSDLLLEGFQRKIIKGRQERNLDEVLLEITLRVQEKLKGQGWVNIQAYKIKDYFKQVSILLGISKDTTSPMETVAFRINQKVKDIKNAME